jgi:hypothetical protein
MMPTNFSSSITSREPIFFQPFLPQLRVLLRPDQWPKGSGLFVQEDVLWSWRFLAACRNLGTHCDGLPLTPRRPWHCVERHRPVIFPGGSVQLRTSLSYRKRRAVKRPPALREDIHGPRRHHSVVSLPKTIFERIDGVGRLELG